MLARDKKGLLKRLFSNQKFLAVLGLILIILISIPLAKNISRRHRINREIKELEAEINQMESQNTDLEKLIKYLESDQFAEEQARLNLGLKKEGEQVAIIKEPPSAATGTAANSYDFPAQTAEGQVPADSNPKKWQRYFFK